MREIIHSDRFLTAEDWQTMEDQETPDLSLCYCPFDGYSLSRGRGNYHVFIVGGQPTLDALAQAYEFKRGVFGDVLDRMIAQVRQERPELA